jgi:hypothetical protein
MEIFLYLRFIIKTIRLFIFTLYHEKKLFKKMSEIYIYRKLK